MIKLDYRSRVPIYRQLEESIMELIVLGVYEKDMQLPSVRALGVELGINPNTIQKAYQELETMGVIYSVTGKGSFIQGIDSAQDQLRVKTMGKLTETLREARLAGVQKEEALALIHAVFDANEKEKEVENQ